MATATATHNEVETEKLTLHVLGMTCAACQRHVEQTLQSTPGVEEARVDLMANKAMVTIDAGTNPDSLITAIRNAGYDAVVPRSAESVASNSNSNLGIKAILTVVAGGLVMLAEMPMVAMHAPASILRYTLLVVTAILMAYAGRSVYQSAWKSARHGTTNMNTMVSLGTGVAFVYSVYVTFAQLPEDVYFDSVLLILGFMLIGKWLEERAKHRANAALNALSRLQPVTARVRLNGTDTIIPLDAVKLGDSVVILAGERFPVDAILIEGRTTVDESMLTGESTPLPREAGDKVLAGSLNYDGTVLCRAEGLGEETMLAQMTRIVEQAQGTRAPMERLADRASAVFVPVVLALTVITFVAWLFFAHSLADAIRSTVAVLVIACPCAMGLAVPAALTVAIGRGAQLGVLFKGGEALERVARIDTLVLDKTGTLTIGHPVLEATTALGTHSADEMLSLAASVESASSHPLATAIVDAAKAKHLTWPQPEDAQTASGRGISAKVSGHSVLLGNQALFTENGLKLPEEAPTEGATRLWMAIDGTVAGYFDARDALHPDAARAMAALKSAGLSLEMLTGDTASAAQPIAAAAGIAQVRAGLQPLDKLERVRQLATEGRLVGMAGDGINDAAALAESYAGFAMGTGADLAQEAGDVLLVEAKPTSLITAVQLARATTRIMRQNLGWAVGYNLLSIPLAAGVFYPALHLFLPPSAASAAMALSDVSVLANSLRLNGWRLR